MKSNDLIEISYKKSLKLLTIQGWFFRNTDLDAQCIEIIDNHFRDEKKLSIIIKIELIDAISFNSFQNLTCHFNKLSTENDIQIKWLSSPESMIAGQRLKQLSKFPFYTFLNN